MTVAIVIAGGVGSRMGADIPKQFVLVDGKPVLFYTLEAFEQHPLVDAIELVLIEGWEKDVDAWKEQYGITKLKWVVKGGATGQESIRNGVFGLEGKCAAGDIVVVHDGIRPLVETSVLDDVIAKAKEFGTGVASMPYNEQIFLVDEQDPAITRKYIPRETLRRVATPQAYRFDLLDQAYHEAFERSDIRLRDLAELIARECGRKVVFDLPTAAEAAGFSTATVARLDPGKIAALGWKADWGIEDGIRQTLRELAGGKRTEAR